jgi:hypothetical protein
MTSVFWLIIGIGLAVPATLVLITNILLSIRAKDNYTLDLKRVGLVYLVALIGYAITFGLEM